MPADGSDPIRVVVVDDHAVVRRGLFAFLDGEPDLEVVGDAAGGEEALEVLERLDAEGRRPRVVLMDLQMEPVDGIQSTLEIRARFDDVAVVALTSFGEEERVLAALRAGASGYLLKDADAEEVAVAVRAADRGELQLDPAVARNLTAGLRASDEDVGDELTSRELEVLRLVGAGESNKGIAAALRTFRSLPHRLELVGEFGGVQWINDSKATNVSSAAVAIDGMERPTVLLLGGRHKGEAYTALSDVVRRKVKRVIAYGEAAPIIATDLRPVVDVVRLGSDFEEVIQAARAAARPGDAVLLSPACSSYDMFSNYEERGERFRALAAGEA